MADGDAALRPVLKTYFSENGYEVETASDGLDCIRKLRQMAPTALVLDVDLCWGGSEGVLDLLRADHLFRDVPVILTGRSAYPYGSANYIEPPVVAYLAKPFMLATSEATLRDAVAKVEQEMPLPLIIRTRDFSERVNT